MKILKVKIKKQRRPGHCHYIYPDCWDSQKIHVLVYEDHPDHLGEVREDCLCVTDDEMAAKLLQLPVTQEISKKEANIFGRKWKPITFLSHNPEEIVEILRKLLASPEVAQILKNNLTRDEFGLLDEQSSKFVFRRGKEFNIEEYV